MAWPPSAMLEGGARDAVVGGTQSLEGCSRGRDGEVDCEIDEHRDVHLRKHNADPDAQPRKFMRE